MENLTYAIPQHCGHQSWEPQITSTLTCSTGNVIIRLNDVTLEHKQRLNCAYFNCLSISFVLTSISIIRTSTSGFRTNEAVGDE
jgi:hypothetical protein